MKLFLKKEDGTVEDLVIPMTQEGVAIAARSIAALLNNERDASIRKVLNDGYEKDPYGAIDKAFVLLSETDDDA